MFEVYLNDAKMDYDESEIYFHNANFWALKHCSSYYSYDVQNVSDVSYHYDNIAFYLFQDEQDALMFQLRWQR